ncbi:MAG: hypothetical protein JW730_04495 [Anaerolineales bacterium]|nr:hypothetical protein [Anaerolineales bacterium]
MDALLATKLHQPASLTKSVKRSQLLQRLNAGLESGYQIFLVSAPAGFGKTTCVSEWVNTLKKFPVTWLSLDPADDDPGRFFAYLLAALQKLDEHIGQEIAGTLRAGQLPPAEVISITLINDMLKFDREFFLVLDDFHVIQEVFILEFFENLLANFPPRFRLILITREDPSLPLAQLRANNRLTEIRVLDLRFKKEDIERFLREVMGVSISPSDIGVLEDKTEGWIAGLQLAGLSIRDQDNPSDFIANLSGSHRHILAYLTEQVLDRQPEDIRAFLLQTSILDKLTADLCNAVTGRVDSRAVLERLFHANLFLVPLDYEGEWYRYHHLFADLLRSLQKSHQAEKTTELHRRAGHWFAESDMATDAIQHALDAEDYPFAVDLLEGYALDMVMQGYAKTVNDWVKALPADWCSQSPRSNLALAWAHLLRGTYVQASPYLERLESFFSGSQEEEAERQSLKTEWLVMQSLLLNRQGKTQESLAMAEEALKLVPSDDDRVRSLTQFCLATLYQATGKNERAIDAFQSALQASRVAGNTIVEMLSTCGLAQMAFEHGQLHQAYETASPVSAQIEKSSSLPPISTVIFGILGEICYQWHQLERARHFYERALQLSILGGYNSGIIGCHTFFARLFLLEGDPDAAAQEIQKSSELLQVDTPDYVRQETLAYQTRVDLARNRPAAAERALQSEGFSFGDQFCYPDLPPAPNLSYSLGLLYNSSLCFLLDKAQDGRNLAGPKNGLELADQLLDMALVNGLISLALETLLLRAQMHTVQGDHGASQADYRKALELAEPEGFIAVFIEHGQPAAEALMEMVKRKQLEEVHLDYVKRILAALSEVRRPLRERPAPVSSARTRSAALIEPLTGRELDVLRAMSEGLKYKEIGEKLFISQNTVRYHVKSIYGKLNVSNKTQAIKKARGLQLL